MDILPFWSRNTHLPRRGAYDSGGTSNILELVQRDALYDIPISSYSYGAKASYPTEEHNAARSQVLQHGWNSTCYQILNEGFERWWSEDRKALVGYVRSGKCAVVAGAPICAEDDLADAIDEWEAYAQAQRLDVCYFGAESRLQSILKDSTEHIQTQIGLTPEWDPKILSENFETYPSLRSQTNRAVNKGVSVELLDRKDADTLNELRLLRDDWSSRHNLPQLGFTAMPVSFRSLDDRLVFVAKRKEQVVGYLILTPIPSRNGWLAEQFVRSADSPNGTVELMIKHAAGVIRDSGATYLTLGVAPFAIHSNAPDHSYSNWHKELFRWVGNKSPHSYNFRGLYEFKAKFRPDSWQPIALIARDTRLRAKHFHAISKAFVGSDPMKVIAMALCHELSYWIRRSMLRQPRALVAPRHAQILPKS